MIEEKTEVLIGAENTIRRTLEDFPLIKERLNTCIDKLGPSILIATEPIKNALIDLRKRGIQIKYITEITKDNLQYCKELAKIVGEMRHLTGVKGNFGVTEFSYIGTATNQESIPVPQLIVSTVKAFVDQQQYFFDMLWSKSIPATQRFKEIEDGLTPVFIETIYAPDQIRKIELELLEGAKNEVLMILPTSTAFYHYKKEGLLQLLKKKADTDNVNIRILSRLLGDPSDNGPKKGEMNSTKMNDRLNTEKKNFILHVMESEQQQTKLITIIVDRISFLVYELKDGSTEKGFWKEIGLAIYSNSETTVQSYVSTFETIWFQNQLLRQLKESNRKLELSYRQIASANRQLKVYDNMQREFINVAAHELRTPIQPIIGLSEVLYVSKKDQFVGQERMYLEAIVKNADRLLKLTDNILDVTRIENNSLRIKKEKFDLYALVQEIVLGYQQLIKKDTHNIAQIMKQKDKTQTPIISLHSARKCIFVHADRQRINQVVSNLISNAIKFTPQGRISIKLSVDSGQASFAISDTGRGIDPTILTRLFTKFATKSDKGGTGLGLYISKSIIDAHGGRIWALNKSDRKKRTGIYEKVKRSKNVPERPVHGATFIFTLPIYHE